MKNQFIIRIFTTAFLLLLLPIALFAAEPKEILLWPNGAPGSEGKTGDERVRITPNGDNVVSSVHRPSITAYLPSPDKATGAAVIVAPGGGHREMWMTHEGSNPAKWFSDHGIATFVLKYRLARETNSTYTIDEHSLGDMQRAIRLVRSRATEWGLQPNHIGALGFSAGGELVFLAAQRFDEGNASTNDLIERVSSKPDFQALIYPGSSRRIEPTTNTPPVFMACGFKDRQDISEGLPNVYLKFKAVKVPAELHIFSGVGHGFGYSPNSTSPANKWVERFNEWLADSGFLKKQ